MPEGSGMFEKLSKRLTTEERHEMLERITAESRIEAQPLLSSGTDDGSPTTVESYLKRIGFFRRLFLFIRAFLAQREVNEIVEDTMVDSIGRKIGASYSGMFDYRTQEFGDHFRQAVKALERSLSVLVGPLNGAFGAGKKEFLGFLGSTLLPIFHEKMMEALDPTALGDDYGDEFAVRKHVQLRTRELLTDIDKESRTLMYHSVRRLSFLRDLCNFPYTTLVEASTKSGGGAANTRIRRQLVELGDLLHSLSAPPDETALSAALMWYHQSQAEAAHDTEELEKQYKESVAAIRTIQGFCNRVPLMDILKVLNRNPSYAPEQSSGWEDWYSVYRQFWEEKVEQELVRFAYGKQMDRFSAESEEVFGSYSIKELNYYRHDRFAEDAHIYYERTIRFLLSYLDQVFEEEHRPLLNVFLVKGEFYKSQNRNEFAEAFTQLTKLAARIRELDEEVGPNGSFGHAIEAVQQGSLPSEVRRKRIRSVLANVDRQFEAVIHSAIGALDSIIDVSKGILYGESGNPYDTLSNINTVAGTESSNLMKQLELHVTACERVKALLHRSFDLERAASTL